MDRRVFIGTLTALICGSGCARSDWIERTLVMVDVTGVWHGTSLGADQAFELWLDLNQEGPKVTGSMRARGERVSRASPISGPIEGAVPGDVLTFRQTNGVAVGELTVNGDEMKGHVTTSQRFPIALRRSKP